MEHSIIFWNFLGTFRNILTSFRNFAIDFQLLHRIPTRNPLMPNPLLKSISSNRTLAVPNRKLLHMRGMEGYRIIQTLRGCGGSWSSYTGTHGETKLTLITCWFAHIIEKHISMTLSALIIKKYLWINSTNILCTEELQNWQSA